MEVLALCSFPIEAASTRYRLVQYVKPLAEKGINLTIFPFLDSTKFSVYFQGGITSGKVLGLLKPILNRLSESFSAKKFDVVLIQREAMMFGPPIFEWLAKTFGKCPLILDLDDATYVPYVSKTFGYLGRTLKFFGKTDTLIGWSNAVLCGNRFIAEYVEKKGGKAIVVPTVVDTDIFCPAARENKNQMTLGWIGTHSSFHSLESIFPVIRDLKKKYDFRLKIVGAGRKNIAIKGVEIENIEWNLEREVKDFQSLDIGLYPIEISSWSPREFVLGKSGFKAIEYMAVGMPFVVTPIGVCAEIGVENETHFSASKPKDWYKSLEILLQSESKRRKMGENGRRFSLENYTVSQQTNAIAKVLFELNLNKFGL